MFSLFCCATCRRTHRVDDVQPSNLCMTKQIVLNQLTRHHDMKYVKRCVVALLRRPHENESELLEDALYWFETELNQTAQFDVGTMHMLLQKFCSPFRSETPMIPKYLNDVAVVLDGEDVDPLTLEPIEFPLPLGKQMYCALSLWRWWWRQTRVDQDICLKNPMTRQKLTSAEIQWVIQYWFQEKKDNMYLLASL